MDRRRFIITGFSAAAIAACSSTAGRFGPSLITQGEEILLPNGKKSFLLNVEYVTTTFSGGYKLRGRTYGDMANPNTTVGPSWTVKPGDTLNVRMVNKLPPNPKVTQGPPQLVPQPQNMMEAMDPDFHGPHRPATALNAMNNPHDFNTTNLHVHGLQTVPHLFEPLGTSNPNAEMIAIEPGQTYDYSFPIPKDHPSGLHWYHPHHHGSTDVQVSNGMAGLIYVRGPIDEVPEIAAARDITLVVQTLDVNPVRGKRKTYSRDYIAYRAPKNGGYFLSTKFTMMTVTALERNRSTGNIEVIQAGGNAGRYWVDNRAKGGATYTPVDPAPTFYVSPGEVVRLRFLNGTNYLTLPLILPGFESWLIGFDGVNLLKPQSKDMSGKGTTVVTHENLLTAPMMIASSGNRVEFLFKAPADPGTYTFASMANEGLYFRLIPKLNFARFVVRGNAVDMSIPKKLPKPSREYPLIPQSRVREYRKFVFAEQLNRTDLLFGVAFTINGKLYDEMDIESAPKVGSCEQWRIENAHDEIHPFHLHENSFQVIAINDQPVDPPEIWDTFMVPPANGGVNGSITIRVRFKQWYGKTVWHCHVLPHEDTGMMQNILMV
ncbi:MAG TPA: multicopper oxidase domain-containing protein [Candidatus Baltobacteraceae bacterium]